ncbi:MAG: DUF4391 domain-containing protein [Oscillospiraceae bacterium]
MKVTSLMSFTSNDALNDFIAYELIAEEDTPKKQVCKRLPDSGNHAAVAVKEVNAMLPYDALQIPPACKVDKTIYKKMFYENAALSAADRSLFANGIEKATWLYCLKPETTHISPFCDNTREYGEVEVLEITLAADKGLRRMAEIAMRTIPYPMLLVFHLQENFQLWAAHLRNSQNDAAKCTLEEPVHTDWLTAESPLWQALRLPGLRLGNMLTFYTDVVDVISIHNAQFIMHNSEDLTGEQARQLLAKQQATQAQIAALRARLKKETQFNRKVEINLEIKRLEKENT